MRKIFILIILILIGGGIFLGCKQFIFKKGIPTLNTEEEYVEISSYHIYGTHLNMTGKVKLANSNFDEIYLTLYNGDFKDYEINYEDDGNFLTFNLSDEVNNGIYLENIDRGQYYMFLKVIYSSDNEDNSKEEKYYILSNKTKYDDTNYYTFDKINNKIVINSTNDYSTMMLNVTEKKDNKKIADIILDPGHGGMDGGAEAFGYSERDFTYSLAKLVQEKLDKEGYLVELTRDELSMDKVMEEYNDEGRSVISSELNAKYLLSLHFNSNSVSSVNGLEIYSPANINYDFAKSLAKNIVDDTGINYSKKKTFRLFEGVYCHNFTETEIENALEGYKEKNYKPYNITTNSNYYYMIRETGGIITGAYVDDSNPDKVGVNPYYDSNKGAEAYVLELGYITNSSDLDKIKTKQEEIANAIVKSIKQSLLK